MKAFAATLALLACAAVGNASYTNTVNGVTYTVTHLDADGSELPVEFGPAINVTSRVANREARRQQKLAQGNDKQKRTQTFNNWCGAANLNPPGGYWNEVQGYWTVPRISLRQGQSDSDQPGIVQWVGIDGDGCQSGGLIQGGSGSYVSFFNNTAVPVSCVAIKALTARMKMQLDNNGNQENYAWFEFVPAALQTFRMNVNTGDVMYGYVTADSDYSGNVTVTNITTGQSMNFYFKNGGAALCGTSAEWILEDLTSLPSGNLYAFADFPNNYFSECSASTTGGQTAGPGYNNVNLEQNGYTLCQASISGSNVYVSSPN